VPGYRPLSLGSGADILLSSAWHGRWADITGNYNVGRRVYSPVAQNWLSYDPAWNELDPNGFSYCGGDGLNYDDPDGKCVENAPQNLYFGIAPEMQTSIQTTTYFQNGSSATTGLPGEPDILYDQSQVSGWSYKKVTAPTGRYFSYISENGLPDNYGQTTIEPVNKFAVERQQNLEGLKIMAVGLLYADGIGGAVDATGLRLMTAKNTGLSLNLSSLSKETLIKELTGTTEQANRIIGRIGSGDVGVNILGDDLFAKAYKLKGGTGNASAFAWADQIYLRKSSASIFGETVHEGTHTLDYLGGFQGNVWQWENRAWFYERQFQKATGRPLDFQNVNDMLNYIKKTY
jgi:RHS repeat-associated protein